MRVAGRDNRLVQLAAERDNAAVECPKSLLVRHPAFAYQEAVIAKRLNFKIVIEGSNFLNVGFGTVVKYGGKKLTCLARRADNQPLPMLFEQGFGNTGEAAEILQIAGRYQLVKIFESYLVLCDDDHMVGLQKKRIGLFAHIADHVVKVLYALLTKLFLHTEKDICQHFGIVCRTVMVEIAKSVMLGNNIKLVLF